MRQKSHNALLKSIGLISVLGVWFVLLTQSGLYAQSTGTVAGTVYDQAGAVVPKANVELVNEGTGDTRKITTNSAGYFSFPTVQPGTYSVKVSAAGFKNWAQPGIPVRPGDLREISGISLQVGSKDETIQVEAVAQEVAPVDSGEKSAVLTTKQIENLSLEGRDATELIRTLPGFATFNGGGLGNQAQDFETISPTGGAVGEGVVAGGQPYRGGTDLVMDGAHIIDNGCNCGATATVNGDMVSEVKVQTSNFGADSAKGPVVVNVIGKSGTTAYHGEVYLHARDQSLNSLDWAFKHEMLTSPAGLLTPPPSQFFFPGVQFGGPVPGTHKKLVFTTAYEYYYQHGIPLAGTNIPGLLADNVPTVSMRDGDFTVTGSHSSVGTTTNQDNLDLCNGLGYPSNWSPLCAGFAAGQTFDPTTFDPGAMALMSQVPMPNANPAFTGGYNLLVPENTNQNGWMWRTRADYNLTDNTKVYATYQVQRETDSVPVHIWWQPVNSIPFPGGMSSKDNSQTVSGHFLKVFGPTLTNDVSTALGWINYPLVKNKASGWTAASMGYPYQEVFPNVKSNWAPDIGNGYWLVGMPQMIQDDIFSGNGGTFLWKKYNYSLQDDVTKVVKTHTIKAGFYWEKTVNDQGADTDYNGNWTAATFVGPKYSASPVLNFFFGGGSYDQVDKYGNDSVWYPTYSVYGQDDWKVSKRLTVNLGLRADHLGAWRTPSALGVAAFIGDATQNPSGNAPGFSWHGIQSSIPVTGRNVPVITWQPRLGLAYDLRGNGKTVLRGGWGVYGYRDQFNDYQTPADIAQGVRTFNQGGTTMAYINSIAGQRDPATLGCGPGSTSGLACGNLTGIDLADHQQPVSRNYNFTVSQQAPWGTLVEIGYVGSENRYVDLQGNTNNLDPRNLNAPPIGSLFSWSGSANDNRAAPYNSPCTTPLSATQAGCDFNRTISTASNGTAMSYNGTYAASGFSGQIIPIYPLLTYYAGNNAQVTSHLAQTNYNGLQVSWVRQKGRISYNLNYTWSKMLGTEGTAQFGGLTPSTWLSKDYGVYDIDRSHVVNLSYTFQEGNPLKGNPVMRYALNGWNLSGITSYQSGPDIVTLASTNLGLGGNGPLSPIGTGNSYGLNAMNWLGTNYETLQPTVLCSPTANLRPHQYFNADCFGVPAPGTNGWYQLPYIHGPAYFNSDLALFKTFRMTERQNLEFRLSAFNFLNHPLDSFQNNGDMSINFNYEGTNGGVACGLPGTTNWCPLGTGSFVPTTNTSQTYPGGPIHGGYASTKYGKRVLELSAKYTF
jgi:hypothetical protein